MTTIATYRALLKPFASELGAIALDKMWDIVGYLLDRQSTKIALYAARLTMWTSL